MTLFDTFFKIFCIAVGTLFFNVSQAQSAIEYNEIADSSIKQTVRNLDSFINKKADSHQFSGVVVITRLYPSQSKPRPIFIKFCGLSDFQKGTPINQNTKFITASTAKSFTAVAVLQLVESGKIGIDRPLSVYLSNEEYPHSISNHITIRQLLTHTAGIGDAITSNVFRSAPQTFKHLSQLVRLVHGEQPVDTPGVYHYGGSDYILLGDLIEKVSGQPFSNYMHDYVFIPAGMVNTGFDMKVRPANLAHGYTARNIAGPKYPFPQKSAAGDTVLLLRPNDAILPRTGVPGAVAYTTAPDLVRFAVALARNKLLNKKTKEALWEGKIETGMEGANQKYSYGFFVGMNGNNRMINHGVPVLESTTVSTYTLILAMWLLFFPIWIPLQHRISGNIYAMGFRKCWLNENETVKLFSQKQCTKQLSFFAP